MLPIRKSGLVGSDYKGYRLKMDRLDGLLSCRAKNVTVIPGLMPFMRKVRFLTMRIGMDFGMGPVPYCWP
jgi:hypothetical protein